MKQTLLVLWSILLIISCTEKNTEESLQEKVYEWEVVDSLDLEFLGNPMLSDISPDGSHLLYFDYISSQVLVSDAKGTISHSFSKEEDTPDSYGYLIERPGFYGNDQLVIYGRLGLFLYNLDGEMTKKIRHPETIGGSGSIVNVGKSTESVFIQNKKYPLPKSIRPRNSFPGKQEFYDAYRALELVDLEGESMTEIIPFEEGSHFLNGKGYIQSDYTPAFEAKNSKLYFVHGGDPQLYVYHLSPEGAKLDTTIQLDIQGFRSPEGRDRAEMQEGHVEIRGGNATIRNIHILDKLLLLDYYAGQDPTKAKEAETLWAAGQEEEAKVLYQKIEDETPKGTLLYNLDNLSYIGSVSPPDKTGGRSYASGGGFAWFQKLPDPDIEEDFLRVYKMKLKER